MAYKELNLKNDTYLDQTHMEHIEDGITAAHEQAEANSQALSAQGERVAVLEQTDADHGSAIEALQERATALEQDAEATMSTLETVQEAVAAHGATLETIQQRVGAVEQKNAEQTQAISDVNAIASANTENITQVRQSVNENAGDISALSETLNSTRENVQTLNESVAKLNSDVSAIPNANALIQAHNESGSAHSDIRASVSSALAEAKAYTDEQIANAPSGGESIPKPLTQEWLPKGYPWDGRTVIEWDGNTEGRKTFDMGTGVLYYKVSDVVIYPEDIPADSPATLLMSGGQVVSINASECETYEEGGQIIYFGWTGFISFHVPVEEVGAEIGTYFVNYGEGGYVASLSYGQTTPISEALLPMQSIVDAVLTSVPAAEGGSF